MELKKLKSRPQLFTTLETRETFHGFGKITLYYKIMELKKLKSRPQLFHNTRNKGDIPWIWEDNSVLQNNGIEET
jgi:hypothetical protein